MKKVESSGNIGMTRNNNNFMRTMTPMKSSQIPAIQTPLSIQFGNSIPLK